VIAGVEGAEGAAGWPKVLEGANHFSGKVPTRWKVAGVKGANHFSGKVLVGKVPATFAGAGRV